MTDGAALTTEALAQRIGAIFRAHGLNAVQAEAIAGVIAAAERDACISHGIYRIEGVLRTLRAKKVLGDALPEVCADDGTAIVRVDARGGASPIPPSRWVYRSWPSGRAPSDSPRW